MRHVVRVSAALFFATGIVVAGWPSRDTLPRARGDDPEADTARQELKERRERYLKWMQEYVESTSIRINLPDEKHENGENAIAELVRHPVVRYSSQDYADDATLWVWTQDGRPAALQKIEVNNSGGGRHWTICFASASEGLVSAEWPQQRHFTATQPGVIFRPIPDADPPAESSKKRTAQIKALKERFSGRTTFPQSGVKPNELNPNTRAIFEYTDPATSLPRGAIFSMVGPKTDLNPGFLLFIEARADRQGKLRWEYAGARLGTAGVLLRLDNAEVWSLPIVRENTNVFENWTYFVLRRDFK